MIYSEYVNFNNFMCNKFFFLNSDHFTNNIFKAKKELHHVEEQQLRKKKRNLHILMTSLKKIKAHNSHLMCTT